MHARCIGDRGGWSIEEVKKEDPHVPGKVEPLQTEPDLKKDGPNHEEQQKLETVVADQMNKKSDMVM